MNVAELPLPPLYESVLDDATLDALFTDLGMLGCAVTVTVKSAAAERAAEATFDLESARAALGDGSARGVQIRYVHEGIAWCDTLIRLGRGVRLVRVALSEAHAQATGITK
ncbi:MAG: hypothetical protein H5U40_01585 [Polyangiaceae bacterium]|nr:hypothetical protein [Polyangiaceae bacterium]